MPITYIGLVNSSSNYLSMKFSLSLAQLGSHLFLQLYQSLAKKPDRILKSEDKISSILNVPFHLERGYSVEGFQNYFLIVRNPYQKSTSYCSEPPIFFCYYLAPIKHIRCWHYKKFIAFYSKKETYNLCFLYVCACINNGVNLERSWSNFEAKRRIFVPHHKHLLSISLSVY